MVQILIIDDTKSVHAFVKNLLSKSSEVETTGVFNGSEAMQLLTKENNFDLILLDWEMPVMNGPETLTALKKMNLQTPIIMMTTKNNPEDIAKMFGLGISEYLMKPFTVDILFEKMEFVLGKRIQYAA